MKMKYLIFLFVSSALTICLNATPNVNMEQWRQFKEEYGKVYKTQDEETRRMVEFFKNVEIVKEHNEAFARGETTFDLKLNKRSDMLPEEKSCMNLETMKYHQTKNTFKSDGDKPIITKWVPPAGIRVPNSVDWRTKGYVTDVKDQGTCNSCWAFSTAEAIEGQVARHTGVLASLSEQQLNDCTDGTCYAGGFPSEALNYVTRNGIEREENYPYKAVDQTCHFNESAVVARISGYQYFQATDTYKRPDKPSHFNLTANETLVKLAVATEGPVSVVISTDKKFHLYTKGIHYNSNCNNMALDLHAVLIVGYGTDRNGTDYWLVKNSWGTAWGEEGFIRMARNRDNNCFIATFCLLPTFQSNARKTCRFFNVYI